MASCDTCGNLQYDEDYEDYICLVNMDEDEYVRLLSSNYRECPYYQSDDEYKIVRKQI